MFKTIALEFELKNIFTTHIHMHSERNQNQIVTYELKESLKKQGFQPLKFDFPQNSLPFFQK